MNQRLKVKGLIDYMDSVVTFTGKVKLDYDDGESTCEVELTGKASDVFEIDADLNIRLKADGTVLGHYYKTEDVKAVIDEMVRDFPRGSYYFDTADEMSKFVRDTKIYDNVASFLMKTFPIDQDMAERMTQIMLENSHIDKFAEWENK